MKSNVQHYNIVMEELFSQMFREPPFFLWKQFFELEAFALSPSYR
jgi:hypothetical protein